MSKRATRRQLLVSASAAFSAALAGCAHRRRDGVRARNRPNLLFIYTDDQRFDTIAALGNSEISTPNLDRLVSRGAAFTHAYLMGSTHPAVCMCSRAMLLTGRSLFRAPVEYPPHLVSWPEAMAAAGYRTFFTGKWHNGRNAFARAFEGANDIFFGGMSNHAETPVFGFDATGKYPKEAQRVGRRFSSELFTDNAIAFLRREHDDRRPFFLYVSYTAPHDPRMAPREFADLYDPARVALPPNYLPEHPFDNGEMDVRDEQLAPRPRTSQIVREHVAAYYAMLSHLDAQIGRLLDALEARGFTEDTLIVFTGDNGLAVGQHGLMGKQNLYDHSVRVPLIFAGPGVPAGRRVDALCYVHDIFPTACELAGVAAPVTVEGKSLAPLLRGAGRPRQSLFAAYRNVQRMVRDRRHKLIEYAVNGTRTTQLFDLAADPWEVTNLATRKTDDVERLRGLLRNWQRESNDPALKQEIASSFAGT